MTCIRVGPLRSAAGVEMSAIEILVQAVPTKTLRMSARNHHLSATAVLVTMGAAAGPSPRSS